MQRFVWSSFVPEISSFFGQYLLLCQQIFIPEGILIYDLIPVSHSVKSERCFSITSQPYHGSYDIGYNYSVIFTILLFHIGCSRIVCVGQLLMKSLKPRIMFTVFEINLRRWKLCLYSNHDLKFVVKESSVYLDQFSLKISVQQP